MVIYVQDGKQNILGIRAEQDESNHEDILITPKIVKAFIKNHGLHKELTQKHLLAFGIGTVLAGFFAQWHVGLRTAGPYGMLTAMVLAFLLYFIYLQVLAHFSANFPYAGGPYAYVRQGLGTIGGYLAGVSATLQFVCAAALVLIILRRYFSLIYPELPADYLTLIIFALLMAVHVSGIWFSAIVQFFLTGSALSGIILFFLGSYEAVDFNYYQSTIIMSDTWAGVLTALPAAMWFYLGLEGIAMSAEETRKPQRDLPRSLMTGLGFAAVISLGVWYFGVGALYGPLIKNIDFPLLYVLNKFQGQDKILLTTFSFIHLIVFVSSLHGLINGYSRQVYALSRAGYFPHLFSFMRKNRQTPLMAIIIPGLVSVLISFAGSFQTLGVLTLFFAMLGYMLVIISYLIIRKTRPEMLFEGTARPHPLMLWICTALLIIAQITLVYFNYSVGWIILSVLSVQILFYYLFAVRYINNEAPEEAVALLTQKKVRIQFK